jgi:hypothetical protein
LVYMVTPAAVPTMPMTTIMPSMLLGCDDDDDDDDDGHNDVIFPDDVSTSVFASDSMSSTEGGATN